MNEVVLDAGPIIHLNQIEKLEILEIIDNRYTTKEVAEEVNKEIIEDSGTEIKNLSGEAKDKAKYLSNKYNLELGESTALALCEQENTQLFLTDDLEARSTAKKLEIEPHGTVGIVVKSYSIGKITQKEAVKIIEDLNKKSSLFITSDLVKWAKKQIRNH